ncbi:class I SAM-dependent methyltransferase [Deinococcus humi]|uniref:SAM-dependent methyltransferase n=1 Tax=Deinococcus humi TaxID=662880 RepID=A0A7W8JT05_9DEIO|nr:class I SAM-dependent methyltransferase [Deinococcus humi]MBB5362692.1 SAM-dependent methyltransferase [Deinococcus humi]GGO31096.1 methyltransferase [Deinococcus humi]
MDVNRLPREVWGGAGAYERYVGRWSRPVAREFLARLNLPAGRAWVDVGCGTGALSAAILATADPAEVVGIDRAAGFIEAVRNGIADDRTRFEVADATQLPFAQAGFDVAVSGLVLNFVADPPAMLREMSRVTKSGGTVAAYVWDYAGGMGMMRAFWDAAIAVNPNDAKLDQAERFPLCQPEPLAALWREQGLQAVEVWAIDIPTVFRDFGDFWEPFLGQQGAAPTYLASVDAQTQERIRAYLENQLMADAAGHLALSARAWAVRGTVGGR